MTTRVEYITATDGKSLAKNVGYQISKLALNQFDIQYVTTVIPDDRLGSKILYEAFIAIQS